ncbi:MAG: P22 phage major capsid protein family protein [Nitrospinota bacterium]
MANTLLVPDIITKEALRVLHNQLTFLRTINRDYDDQFAREGAKIGSNLRIRMPNQYTVRSGLVMDTQDVTETSQTLSVATVRGVDMNFTSEELTMSIDNFSQRILRPAMSRLAAEIENIVLSNVYMDIYNFSGTAATTPATINAIHNARTKLNQGLAPKDANRHVLVDSVAMAAIAGGEKGLFHMGSELERAFAQGFFGRASGMTIWESELVPNHTNGTRDDTTPLTNGTDQTGASLVCDGFDANATINQGDVFTIAGVYAVNPETKGQYSHLQQFVVTANATADGSGNATLSISPSIVTTGATQNVSAAAADGSALVFEAAGGSGAASAVIAQDLAYHRDAFTFVTADLELPANVEASRQVFDGISMRYVRDFDIVNSKHPARFDVLFGYRTIRPEWAVRMRG